MMLMEEIAICIQSISIKMTVPCQPPEPAYTIIKATDKIVSALALRVFLTFVRGDHSPLKKHIGTVMDHIKTVWGEPRHLLTKRDHHSQR